MQDWLLQRESPSGVLCMITVLYNNDDNHGHTVDD